MKKLLAILLVLCMVIPAAALGEEVVKIGVYEPATGDSGAGGKQEMLGMQYANELFPTVKMGDTEYKVELVYADNGSSSDKAPSAAQKLVSENVSVVLGSYGSSVSNAGKPYFGEAGIPAIGVTCTNPSVTAGNTHYFRICFLDPFQGVVMANYAKSKGYTKVAILYGNDDDYSIGLADSFEEQCKKNGMEVTAKESGSFSDMDFSAQLTKIASTNPEVVFLPFYGEQASMILSRAASIGMDVTFLGGDGISNIVDFMTDKKLLTKVVYCDHFDANSETEIVKKFKADFKAKYGTDVTLSFSATAYDAALVICQAILRAGSTDKAAIVEQIKAGTFDGVTSTITFDDHNDPIKSAFIMTFDESGNKTFIELLGNE